MSTPKLGHCKGHIAAVILVGVLSLLVASSSAVANSYHDFLCRIPYGPSAGRAAPADGVTYAINNDFVYAEDTCSSGGALYAQMVGETTHPFATEASNTFTAPAGLTISHFVLWRYEADRPRPALRDTSVEPDLQTWWTHISSGSLHRRMLSRQSSRSAQLGKCG